MKMTLRELREFVRKQVLEEAKRKKKEVPKPQPPHVRAYGQTAEAFDFSQPLRSMNLYKAQGAANFGPYTAAHEQVDATPVREYAPAAASMIRKVNESLSQSVWEPVAEQVRPAENVWEELVRLTESQEVSEKHLGFKKLKGKLAHKKGVKNPAALAAKIGRDKYGSAGMAKKAAAGKKK